MKKMFFVFLFISSRAGFSQDFDCSKFSITDYRIEKSDSSYRFMIKNNSLENLHTVVIDSIHFKNASRLPNTSKNTIPTLASQENQELSTSSNIPLFNDFFLEINFNTDKSERCFLPYSIKYSLDCNHLKLLNDTISINLDRTGTDLKFTYDQVDFGYPNYNFKSMDDKLIITNPFAQTYLLFSEICMGSNCEYYTPFAKPTFSSDLAGLNYIKGIFTVGQLANNTCDFDIIYKFEGKSVLGTFPEKTQHALFFPNPVKNEISLQQAGDWEILNSFGNIVQQGKETLIPVSSLPSGNYMLKVNGQVEKFIKE